VPSFNSSTPTIAIMVPVAWKLPWWECERLSLLYSDIIGCGYHFIGSGHHFMMWEQLVIILRHFLWRRWLC